MRGAALGSPQENLRPAPRQQPFPSTHCVFAFKGKQRAVPHACEEPGAALALGAASGGTCQCLPWQGSKAQGWRCSLALAHCAECLNKSLTPTRNGRFGEVFCTAFAAGWKLRAELTGGERKPWARGISTAVLCTHEAVHWGGTGSGGEFVPLLIERHFWQRHAGRGRCCILLGRCYGKTTSAVT